MRDGVKELGRRVRRMSALTEGVLEETKARVLKGDTHHPGTVLSESTY